MFKPCKTLMGCCAGAVAASLTQATRHEKAPESFSGAFDFQISQLIGVVAVGLGFQKLFYFVRLEPAVASKSDAVTMEQASVRPAAHRVRMGIEKLGDLGHG